MTTKASAKDGGQASIGDIINNTGIFGQMTGNNTVVIQNLHITTLAAIEDQAPSGFIAYFGLQEWWLEKLTQDERGAIEDAIGNDVSRDRITSTNRTAQSWLRGIALRIGAVHPQLASKLRSMASGIETGIYVDDYWQRQFAVVKRYWTALNFEAARVELRAIGYRMREENALPEYRSSFADLQSDLLHADPYYTGVMAEVIPIIKSRPGIIQSAIAKSLPDIDIERFRHAMYYGEVIGDIKRVKQGRSYGLYANGRN